MAVGALCLQEYGAGISLYKCSHLIQGMIYIIPFIPKNCKCKKIKTLETPYEKLTPNLGSHIP